MSKGDLILVTGVTGFLGSHIVHQLLEADYRVRGVARSTKAIVAQQGYAQYGDKYEVVGIDDLVRGDFTNALKGVKGVIHVAAPLIAQTATPAEALAVTIDGSLNIFRQAEKAGVTNFVFVSSIATFGNYVTTRVTDESWFQTTREDAEHLDPLGVYVASKTLSEQAVWKFADEHPHIEMTTVNPPYLFGPYAPGWRNPEGSRTALSTNAMIYGLLSPTGPNPHRSRGFIDVRDAARGTMNALTAPPTSRVGRKRIIMSGEAWFSGRDAVEYIAEVRPELKGRLNKEAKDAPEAPKCLVDNTRAKEVLGLTGVTAWKTTVIEAVDDLIRREEEGKKRGLAVPV